MRNLLALATASILVAGCATVPRDAAWVQSNLRISPGDRYENAVQTTRTPMVRWRAAYPSLDRHDARLVHRDGSFALEVVVRGNKWKFIHSAETSTGRRLRVDIREQKFGYLRRTTEILQVDLGREFVAAHRDGFSVKLWGERGRVSTTVPASHVRGLLAAVYAREGTRTTLHSAR